MRLLRSLKTGFNISGKVILLALLTYSAFAVEPSEKAKQASKYIQSKDYDQARPLLIEASKDGDAVAQFALSNAYENGLIGFKSDIKQRNYWLKLSADNNYPDAQYKWATQNLNRKHQEEGLDMLWGAANQGHFRSQLFLIMAETRREGRLADKVVAQAERWASSGNVDLMSLLGRNYYSGDKLTQNHKYAAKWFLMAAEKGNAHAQFSIGFMHDHGQGVEKNLQLAEHWLKLSAKQNFEPAINHLKAIEERKQLEQKKTKLKNQIDVLQEDTVKLRARLN